MNQKYITLTPINLNNDKDNKKKYIYEEQFFEHKSKHPKWTIVYNTSTAGNLFGFVINKNLL